MNANALNLLGLASSSFTISAYGGLCTNMSCLQRFRFSVTSFRADRFRLDHSYTLSRHLLRCLPLIQKSMVLS